LFNLLGGISTDGVHRRILFPLVPEYIGYADQHLEPNTFLSQRPLIQEIDDHRFKYHIDFDALDAITDTLGAVCVSRPTNPTGNVLTDEEISRLRRYCRAREVPLIIDNAYGAPFPHILFKDISPVWDENIILSMSLSKLGLPSTRTGIIVAKQSIIEQVTSVNAILSLSTGSLGQIIAYPMLQDSSLLHVSKEIVKPYYFQKSIQAQQWFDQSLAGLPYRLHVSEGALFLWAWFKDLKIPTDELYERLKQKGVLVIPGKYFFYGQASPWKHQNECIRITYSQDNQTVERGIQIIGDVLRSLY
jgi:valine--pyruvate aminotransferase